MEIKEPNTSNKIEAPSNKIEGYLKYHIHNGVDAPRIKGNDLVSVSYNSLEDTPTIPTYQDSEWVLTSEITSTFYTSNATNGKTNGTAIDSADIIIYTHNDVDGTVAITVQDKQAGTNGGSGYANTYKILKNTTTLDSGTTSGGTSGAWNDTYTSSSLTISNGDTITVRAVLGTTDTTTEWRIILKGGKVIAPTEFSTSYP